MTSPSMNESPESVAMSSETQGHSPEPVAWLIEWPSRKRLIVWEVLGERYLEEAGCAITPLYAHPSPDVRDAEKCRSGNRKELA